MCSERSKPILHHEMSDMLRERAKQLSAGQAANLKRELEQQGKSYFVDSRMSFPAEILIVTAAKRQVG